MPWNTEFDDPVILPNGQQMLTFRDAANYIQNLPKVEHDAPEWQAAIAMLIKAAETGGAWLMMARMGVLRALHRNVERVFNPDRKEPHWGQAEAEAG